MVEFVPIALTITPSRACSSPTAGGPGPDRRPSRARPGETGTAGLALLVDAGGGERAHAGYMEFSGFIKASDADDPERRAQIEAQVPLRRLGTMEELAEFTAVLLDGRSRFQTDNFSRSAAAGVGRRRGCRARQL